MGHCAEGKKTGGCFEAGSASRNETHVLRLQDKTSIWGVMELRETKVRLFSGHGAEGKETHLCWVVR